MLRPSRTLARSPDRITQPPLLLRTRRAQHGREVPGGGRHGNLCSPSRIATSTTSVTEEPLLNRVSLLRAPLLIALHHLPHKFRWVKNSAEKWGPRGRRVRSPAPRRCSASTPSAAAAPPPVGAAGGLGGAVMQGSGPKGDPPSRGTPRARPRAHPMSPRAGGAGRQRRPRPGPRPGPPVVRDGRFIRRGGLGGMSGGRGGLICEPRPHPRCWRPLRSAGGYRSRGWSPSRATGSPGGGCEGAGRALEGEFGPGASAPRAPSPSLRARARAPVSAPTVTIYAC